MVQFNCHKLTCFRRARTNNGKRRVDEDVTRPALAELGFAALYVPRRSRTALMAASFASDKVELKVRSTARIKIYVEYS